MKSEVKLPSCGNSKSKALQRYVCCPVLPRGQEGQPSFRFAFLTHRKLWVGARRVQGACPREGSSPGTKLRQDAGLWGFPTIFGISSVGFTVGTKLLGLQVQVKLLDASVITILFLDVFVFV